MRFLRDEAWRASAELARTRGPFPNWSRSAWASGRHPYFGGPGPMRNALVTTVAPTGTISILAGCSAGIEPLYSVAFTRRILDGEELPEVHPYFREVAQAHGFASPALFERAALQGSVRRLEEVPPFWRDVFACAHDVAPEAHLRMQAAFQESVDNAVSKTVNLPASATPDEVRRVFELAVELDVKGVTVYRDGSRAAQPMAHAAASAAGDLPGALGRLVALAASRGASPGEIAAALGRSGPPGGSTPCPRCGAPLVVQEGCERCSCGYGKC
jgi:ribonucleoside-diphosphate reductase alpha chain